MNRSSIEWTDYTWNPVTGCRHGCQYCYARRLAEGRLKGRFGYENGFEPTLHTDRLEQPSRVTRPARIFVSSMGDLMGDWVPDRWIHQVIEAIWDAPQHTFQLLTKNPARYREFKWPPNVWFGTSIDGNGGSMERLAIMRDDDLLNWGDAIRFVSFEPLLADVTAHPEFELDGLDWVIVGAQTGPGADPINLNYVANLGYQVICRRIPFFMKDNVPTRILRIQEFPDSDLKELTKSMDGDEMDVCPHCDVEMEPKRDGKTGEIFCTNCLDTLR